VSGFECFSSSSELNYFCDCHGKLSESFVFKDLVWLEFC